MSHALILHGSHPGLTIQDLGRPGYLAFGLSRGGAADRMAVAEGAALLGQSDTLAVLEMAGMGSSFEASEDTRIALTGAPMPAQIDGATIAWNASHLLPKGARLTIGAATTGVYGYLHVGGGFETAVRLGSRGAHLAAGIGNTLSTGDHLHLGPDAGKTTGMKLEAKPRFAGGTVRIVPSLQTSFFAPKEIDRFQTTAFRRDTRGNRMGVKLIQDDQGFQSAAGLSVLSEVIVPGDIQITGDGTPFLLLSECQTTGGYPRIGSVLPADLPIVAQAQPGVSLRFAFVSLDDGVAIEREDRDRRNALSKTITPLVRDPRLMHDLLSFNLIGGVIADTEDVERWG